MGLNKKDLRISYWLGELLFYIHLPIFLLWVVLFFIPVGWWPQRVAFHFYFVIAMVLFQIAGGILWQPVAHKFDLRCPLTIIMQRVRGYSMREPAAYDHSFIVEFFERVHIAPKKNTITFLIIFSIILIVCQYFFGFLRIP